MSTRQWLNSFLPAVLVALIILVGGVAPASARPAVPGVPDCKDPPVAQEAGFGLGGVLDPKPDPLPAQADPFTGKSSIYDQYGYAGLRWSTYDLGCGGPVRDPGASADTMTGNALLGLSVTLTSLANGIHNNVAQPDTYMKPLDKVVARVTGKIHESIWSPWGGVALLGVVALLLTYSLRGQLSSATSSAAWALLVLTVLAGVVQYPSKASTFFDDTVTSTIGQVQASAAGVVTDSDSSRAQGALTVDRALYDSWLRGVFGSSTSPAAKKWGPRLYKSSAISWHELAKNNNPDARKDLLKTKSDDWKDLAEEIKDEDPATYQTLQGKAGGRTGAGFMALLGTVFTTVFRLIADIFLLVGLVLLRLLVMFLPAAAVVGVLSPMSSILRRMANLGGAALINVVAFSVAATVHTIAIVAVLESASGPGMTAMSLVLCAVLTLAAFILTWPLLSFRLAFGSGGMHRPSLRRAGRHVASYVLTREAVEKGVEDAEVPARKKPADEAGKSSKNIPPDRPHKQKGTGYADLDADSERIYKGLGIRNPADTTSEPPRREGARESQTPHLPEVRSDAPVLVGTVVSGAVGPQADARREDATSFANPAHEPRIRIYDPTSKRMSNVDAGGDE